MNWDEDIDLSAGKKNVIKQGRRSSSINAPPDEPEKVLTPPEAPRRKTGGWGEENKPRSKGGNSNLIEEERFQTEYTKEEEEIDNIPEIPDIDDLQDDPLNLTDVAIPTVVVKKSTYKELDNQFEHLQSSQPSFGNLGDIDLACFTSRLYPEKDVQRPNEVWTMESLYQDIKNHVTSQE